MRREDVRILHFDISEKELGNLVWRGNQQGQNMYDCAE